MLRCIKIEPFIEELNGKWLTIKSTDAKSHKICDIEFNDTTKGIVQGMRDRYHYYLDEYGQKSRNVIMNYLSK